MLITRTKFELVDDNLEYLEKRLDAKLIGFGPVKNTIGNWINAPFGYFKANKPASERPEGHTDFVAFGMGGGFISVPVIVGLTDFNPIIEAIYIKDNDELVYSTYRHDMVYDSTGQVAIDGGRDYTKVGGDPNKFELVSFDMSLGTVV